IRGLRTLRASPETNDPAPVKNSRLFMAATFPQRALLGVDPFDHALNLPRVLPLSLFIRTPRPKAVRRCRLTDVQDIAQLATEGGAALRDDHVVRTFAPRRTDQALN